MKKFLFFLLLVMFFGTGYIVGQIQGPRNVGKDQDLKTWQQKATQPLSEKEQSRKGPERIAQGLSNWMSRTGNISHPLHSMNQDDLVEPEPPPHEIMDFSQDPFKISDSEHLSQKLGRFPTEEEMEEDLMRSLWADAGVPFEEIESMARMFADFREQVKKELAQTPPSTPPPPTEESIDQK